MYVQNSLYFPVMYMYVSTYLCISTFLFNRYNRGNTITMYLYLFDVM